MFKLLMGVFLRQQVEDPPLGMPIPAPILNHPLYSDQRYRLKHLKIIQRLKVGPEKQHSSCSFRLIKRPQTVLYFSDTHQKGFYFFKLTSSLCKTCILPRLEFFFCVCHWPLKAAYANLTQFPTRQFSGTERPRDLDSVFSVTLRSLAPCFQCHYGVSTICFSNIKTLSLFIKKLFRQLMKGPSEF